MIKRITIKGFKSIRDLTVELTPVTVLVGRSGTGKSNFVQAIRFLRNYLVAGNPGQQQSPATEYEGGWERILAAGVLHPQLRFDVVFRVPAQDEDYRYILAFGDPSQGPYRNMHHLDPCEESLSLGSKTLFHRIYKRIGGNIGGWSWVSAPNTAVVPHPHEFTIRSLPAIQEVVYANAVLTSGIGFYHLPSSVLGIGSSGSTPYGDEIAKRLSGFRDDGANYLDVMRAIIQDFAHPQTHKKIFAALKLVNPTVHAVNVNPVGQSSVATVEHRFSGDKGFGLRLEQESDGFRRFYAHLLALYQVSSKLVNIFEEPENAIYPGALSLLADEFKAAPESGRGQVILTTHSPGLLNNFDVESVRAVEMHDGATVIGPVSSEQRDAIRERLLTTGELLTVDQARIGEPHLTTEATGA